MKGVTQLLIPIIKNFDTMIIFAFVSLLGVWGNMFFGQTVKFLNSQFGERPVSKHYCSQLGQKLKKTK